MRASVGPAVHGKKIVWLACPTTGFLPLLGVECRVILPTATVGRDVECRGLPVRQPRPGSTADGRCCAAVGRGCSRVRTRRDGW